MESTSPSCPSYYCVTTDAQSQFTKQNVQVNKDGKTVLTGYSEPANKLWRFPQYETIPPTTPQVRQWINAILPEVTMSDTLNFLHRSVGSPTKTTLLNAIRKK